VSPLTFRMTKEQIEKDQERDQNMAKMMTQLDLLGKNVLGCYNVWLVLTGCAKLRFTNHGCFCRRENVARNGIMKLVEPVAWLEVQLGI